MYAVKKNHFLQTKTLGSSTVKKKFVHSVPRNTLTNGYELWVHKKIEELIDCEVNYGSTSIAVLSTFPTRVHTQKLRQPGDCLVPWQ